jgi:hypothetical protein
MLLPSRNNLIKIRKQTEDSQPFFSPNKRYLCPQMKFIASTIFILLLLTQIFSKWLMVIDYTINKDYIAKNLCENRNKPTLHCNGKCQLMKKMAVEDDQTNKTTSGSSVAKTPFTDVLFNATFVFSQLTTSASDSLFNDFYLVAIPSSFHSSIFRPPLV